MANDHVSTHAAADDPRNADIRVLSFLDTSSTAGIRAFWPDAGKPQTVLTSMWLVRS
jgi:hypothetical protein